MSLLRRSIYPIISIALVCAVYVFLGNAAPSPADKNITVVTKEQQVPQWKLLWDEARDLAQRQENEEAVLKYQEVLTVKPHIEEVKWELAKTYLTLRQFDKALVILESLLEASPDKIDYLVRAGEASLQQQKASLANRYFGQALAIDPGGPLSEAALFGMIEALSAQNKKALTIPLMEQLFQRGALGPDSILELARYHIENNDAQQASFYFRGLIGKYRVDENVVFEAAQSFEQAAYMDEAAVQWEKYLSAFPSHIEFRIKLSEYYQNKERLKEALPHMLYLLEHDIDRERYLLPVARIYLYELGRTDRALFYYERYRQEFPDGIDVSAEINGLQTILANDLLAIVENNGVWMLWRDLAEVTPDRIGIYRTMADILEKMGREKENELIEILKIINAHEPDDVDIISQLVHLYIVRSRSEDCLSFLAQVADANREKPRFHLLQAQCESAAGDDFGRLESYASFLKLRPKDENIRIEALKLAGSLGLVDKLGHLHQGKTQSASEKITGADFMYVQALLSNGLSRSAEQFLMEFNRSKSNQKQLMALAGKLSEVDLRQNRPFKAEQNIRMYATRYPDSSEGLLLMAGFFIAKNNIAAAQLWHDRLEMKAEKLSLSQNSVLFHQNLLIDRELKKVDVYQRAVQYLNNQLRSNLIVAEDVDTLLFAAEHYIITNRFDESIRLINRFRPKFKGVDRLYALLTIARKEKAGMSEPWSNKAMSGISFSGRIAVAEQLMRMGQSEDAYKILQEVSVQIPDSTRTKVLLAEVQNSLLEYEAAHNLYTELAHTYDRETYFIEQVFRMENMQGVADSIFKEFSVVIDESGRKNAIRLTRESLDYPDVKLLWARSLWSADRWEESLDVYGLLDTEMNRELDLMKQELQQVPAVERTGVLGSTGTNDLPVDNSELTDWIMSNEFIVANLDSDIAETSSRYYDAYRWGNIIKKEMTAKSSLKAKEFYQAEIDYRELFQEDAEVTEDVYSDLATVYSRLGRYQEETELLEKIKETNITYPDLSQITEKNIRRRQPYMFLDGRYLEKEGRDGSIDLTEQYFGLGLQVNPTLYQEAGFVIARSEYGNSHASTLAKSTSLLGNYDLQFSDFIEGSIQLGFEDFDEDVDTFLIYDFMLKGTLEQRVELYGGIKQEPVDDTVESLLGHIYRRDVQLGFSLDYFFGMFFGFDLDFIEYSDDNNGEQYYLWSSYRWFGERSAVDITYSYLNIQNQLSNEMFVDETGDDELPYWSPGDYWKHRLSMMYKMELWPTGRLQSGTGSFSAKYGLGFEKGDVFTQEVDLNILLEITQSFLVKGTFSTILSDDYDMLNSYLSLVYRW